MTCHLEKYMPHSGDMSLLGSLIEFSEDILVIKSRIEDDNIFLVDNYLPSIAMIEYMAQSIAVHSNMCAEQENPDFFRPAIGLLLGVKSFRASSDILEIGSEILITISRNIVMQTGMAMFDCDVKSDEFTASASLSVFQPEDSNYFQQEQGL